MKTTKHIDIVSFLRRMFGSSKGKPDNTSVDEELEYGECLDDDACIRLDESMLFDPELAQLERETIEMATSFLADLAEDDLESDETEEEEEISLEKSLPIEVIDQKIKDDPIKMLEFSHQHPVKDVYEYVNLPLSTDAVQKSQRIPFEHKETKCDLIINQDTVVISAHDEACNIIIKRPSTYYRTENDPERFPCECLCVVDDKTYKLFETFETLKERANQLSVFFKLSKTQQAFVYHMADRPIHKDSSDELFTPIRDLSSLKMMYEVCKYTYKPAVRARIESLKDQLKHAHGSDRTDLINQLAFAIGIDTEARSRPKRTYEECMEIMDKHLYGLQEVKENIIEFIIAMQESDSTDFRMLMVGPPGVGKTSFVEAIGECLGDDMSVLQIDCSGVNVVTMSGLIKSYGGAKAGKIMDGYFEKSKTDLVLLLDEVDKMCSDSSGDPYSALIKPLAQKQFYDEYVAADTDVSSTKFIATANDISKIPDYILSRFENNIFYLSAYSKDEKIEIAQKHIIPRKLATFKVTTQDCMFTDEALSLIIDEYCSDEGVRELEGNITKLFRKIITERSRGFIDFPFCVEPEYIESHLKKKSETTQIRKIGYIQ